VSPADDVEARQVLRWAAAYHGPCYVRLVRDATARFFGDDYRFELGKAVTVREGRDVTLIGSGLMVSRCLAAAETLAKEGISADVVNISTLKPLDTDLIVSCARRTGAVVTAENHTVLGGLGGAVAEVLGDAAPVPFRRVGIQDRFGTSGPLDELFPEYGLTAKAVCEAARAALGAKTRP
ncbi:MAG TPA: transketolase C-terminal domain-containing protein, partial [Candidatus Methylomirabilis sp.]|nr:transketolase C-terminal domain-containing protein [Candidatus Methylomirabilis sp.]